MLLLVALLTSLFVMLSCVKRLTHADFVFISW